MAWQLNDYFKIDGLLNSVDNDIAYDGKNLWVQQTDGTVIVLEFWGMYNDENIPNEEYKRYLLNASNVDDLNYAGYGPVCRIVKTLDFVNKGDLLYSNDYIYHWTGLTLSKVHVSGQTADIASVYIDDSSEIIDGLSTTQGNSNGVICGSRFFYTSKWPMDEQYVDDRQKLFSVNITTGVRTDHGRLQGKKQKDKRHLAIVNSSLYISCMGTMSVLKHNAENGGYLTSIVVNRDVGKIKSYGNSLFVMSSYKGKVTLGTKDYPSTMISEVTEADSVVHKFGILTGGDDFALDGTTGWFVNTGKSLQRTLISGVSIIGNKGSDIVDSDFTCKLIDNTNGDFGDVTNIIMLPAQNADAWNGTSIISVNQPKKLLLISATKIGVVYADSPFVWKNHLTINQYTAVSTGGQSYKEA
jgi:hypothetical protein